MPFEACRRERVFSHIMAIPNRNANPENVVAGARTFLTTSSTAGRRRLLQSDHSARLFIRVLYNCRTQGKFRLHEFVVMPDHFHVLLTIDTGMTIERAVQLIKGGFSFRAGRELGMRSPVWQKGFSDRRITGVDEFERIRKLHSQESGQTAPGQGSASVSIFFRALRIRARSRASLPKSQADSGCIPCR